MSETTLSTITETWLAALQKNGYRLTGPLRTIVELLAHSLYTLTPVDLFEAGRKIYPGLGLVTVYRTLDKMEELGLIQRVHQPGACNRYLRAAQGHEHLLLCTSCGRVETFSGDDLDGLIQNISKHSGFTIQEHWLQLFGLCSNCKANLPA
jgi:Fur family transcriptional regulator, ferric uptake regulator